MTKETERVDAYLETIKRLEPDIAMIDAGTAQASIAISLKRIADALDGGDRLGIREVLCLFYEIIPSLLRGR